jgi:hypothetical protein
MYYYAYQLVELDRVGRIQLTRGKTTKQYLREIRRYNDIHRLIRHTSQLFEGFFFGRHVPPRHEFEACWNELERFQHWTQSSQPERL